jgi:mannose/fructose-specific phosphotransferase system component IIA
MSEQVPVQGILLAHGNMAEGIVDAVRCITGAEPDVLLPMTNRGHSPQTLAREVGSRVADQPTILFTDLQSGSCGFAAGLLRRDVPGLVVISGVNLPMLLEFVMRRELPVEELVPRLLEKGRAAVVCAPASFEAHADRAVSRG